MFLGPCVILHHDLETSLCVSLKINAEKEVEKRETSYTVGRNVNWLALGLVVESTKSDDNSCAKKEHRKSKASDLQRTRVEDGKLMDGWKIKS